MYCHEAKYAAGLSTLALDTAGQKEGKGKPALEKICGHTKRLENS